MTTHKIYIHRADMSDSLDNWFCVHESGYIITFGDGEVRQLPRRFDPGELHRVEEISTFELLVLFGIDKGEG